MRKHLKTLIKEKPEGATHYDKVLFRYMKRNDQGDLMAFIDGDWKQVRFSSGGKNDVVCLVERPHGF